VYTDNAKLSRELGVGCASVQSATKDHTSHDTGIIFLRANGDVPLQASKIICLVRKHPPSTSPFLIRLILVPLWYKSGAQVLL